MALASSNEIMGKRPPAWPMMVKLSPVLPKVRLGMSPDLRGAADPVCAAKAAPATLTKALRFMGYMIPRNSEPEGRKMRVDTTVVETDIHYPTDSTLLGDGVRAQIGR